jgi:hypothetical protein
METLMLMLHFLKKGATRVLLFLQIPPYGDDCSTDDDNEERDGEAGVENQKLMKG